MYLTDLMFLFRLPNYHMYLEDTVFNFVTELNALDEDLEDLNNEE